MVLDVARFSLFCFYYHFVVLLILYITAIRLFYEKKHESLIYMCAKNRIIAKLIHKHVEFPLRIFGEITIFSYAVEKSQHFRFAFHSFQSIWLKYMTFFFFSYKADITHKYC